MIILKVFDKTRERERENGGYTANIAQLSHTKEYANKTANDLGGEE